MGIMGKKDFFLFFFNALRWLIVKTWLTICSVKLSSFTEQNSPPENSKEIPFFEHDFLFSGDVFEQDGTLCSVVYHRLNSTDRVGFTKIQDTHPQLFASASLIILVKPWSWGFTLQLISNPLGPVRIWRGPNT